MTDISFPPLHDLASGELDRRKLHLLGEIARGPRARRIPPLRLRYAVLAAAAASAAAAAAVVFSGVLGMKRPTIGLAPGPRGGDFLDMSFVRDAQGTLTAIHVIVRDTTLGGTALLQIVPGREVHSTGAVPWAEAVFQERVPMTDIADPLSGPPGTVQLSRWSGTLSPSDWKGGCGRGPYALLVNVSPATNPTGGKHGVSILSGDIRCRR